MRTAFIKQLIEEARKNDKIFLLVGDLGYNVIEPFANEFPKRYKNVGIAEQNMAGIAAGLAMLGYNVYIYSIGNFPTLRCIEQLRNDIAYYNANVKVVAVGAGYAYGAQGVSHQATEEIGMLRTIPNMVVATPGDPVETKALVTFSSQYKGCMYIRLGKAGEKVVHQKDIKDLKTGDILEIRQGNYNSPALLVNGSILGYAYDFLNNNQINSSLYSLPFVKPMNKLQLYDIVRHHSRLIVLEEHQKSCGVGSAILEVLNDMMEENMKLQFPYIKRIAIPDTFYNIVGDQQYMRQVAGLILKKEYFI